MFPAKRETSRVKGKHKTGRTRNIKTIITGGQIQQTLKSCPRRDKCLSDESFPST